MSSEKTYNEEEITLKDLLMKMSELFSELWKHKFIIMFFGLVFGVLFVIRVWDERKMYDAPLTFMLNDDEAGDLNFNGILGQIGLGAGMGGDSNLDKILELSKTRKIMQSVILSKSTVNGRSDYLGNHIIENLDSLDRWETTKWYQFRSKEKANSLKDFRFTHDSIPAFKLKENSALKKIYHYIAGKDQLGGIVHTSHAETSGIMKLTCKTSEPELSIELISQLFKKLSTYYVEKTVEKQQFTFEIIKTKTDSLFGALTYAEVALANFRDKNRGLFKNRDVLTEARLTRDVQKLNIMYGEAAKNKEMADFTLQNKIPYIQIIDEPLLPIRGQKSSKLKNLIIGGMLGGLLASLFFIFRKIIRDALAS